jgi:hypothetical protein
MTVVHVEFLLVSLLIIVLIVWAWKAMKGTAGRKKPWLITVSALIIALILVPLFREMTQNRQREQKAQEESRLNNPALPAPLSVSQIPVARTQKMVYRWTWYVPSGEYIHGRNRNADEVTVAEMIENSTESLYFDVPYIEFGRPERERIRLGRVGLKAGKTWSGDRDQDRPKEHSRVDMRETGTNAWSGTITWLPDGPVAICSLIGTME